MEFLGDSVLNTIVSEYLYRKYKSKDEGFFSKSRSNIVGRKNLNKIGKQIIPKKLINHNLKIISDNIYGNILESIIGAIYLDLGHQKSKEFVIKNILTKTRIQPEKTNYKSKILEWSQKNNKKIEFINNKQKGPDHNKEYFIQLLINGEETSKSWGKTIKSAEQKSAEIAYNIVN